MRNVAPAEALLDLLKNRATGDNTRELVIAGTEKERVIWKGTFKEMLDNETPPVDYRSLVEPIAILEAANIAQQKASRILLKDVWEDA